MRATKVTRTSAIPFGLFFGGLPFFFGPGCGGGGALLWSDAFPFSEAGYGDAERPASEPSLHRRTARRPTMHQTQLKHAKPKRKNPYLDLDVAFLAAALRVPVPIPMHTLR